MAGDPTETVRREMVAEINEAPKDRKALEKEFGQVWNTEELGRDFQVTGFSAPFVLVRRKENGKGGTLMFQHSPRFYWGFEEA